VTLLDQWIEALESNEYTQGRGRLAYVQEGRTQYCCLGVVCDVEGLRFRNQLTYTDSNGVLSTVNGSRSALSEYDVDLLKKLFPSRSMTELVVLERALITANDNMRFSFADIAKFLRAIQVDLDGFIDEYESRKAQEQRTTDLADNIEIMLRDMVVTWTNKGGTDSESHTTTVG
jgi:hypothetical protein